MNSESYKYKSTDIAKCIVARANEKKIVMNMTKLQKLLYAAYGIYLAIKNERLTNEYPKAWPYGPVFPTTREKLLKFDFVDYDISSDSDCSEDVKNDEEIDSLISLVLKTFGNWTAGQLTEWSHEPGSPWDKTVNTDGFKWNNPISDEYIKEYFLTILVKNE